MTVQTPGRHHLIDLYDCDPGILDDRDGLRAVVLDAVRLSGATIIADVFHKFSPQGVTGVVAIAESHVSIHTWPEHGFAAVDAFTCSEQMNVGTMVEYFREKLKAGTIKRSDLERGSDLVSKLRPALKGAV